MHCTRCGSSIKENVKYCPRCGNEIRTIKSSDIPTSNIEEESPVEPISVENVITPQWKPSPVQKKIFLSILVLLILGGAGYYFFLKPNPKRDGKKAAMAYCECSKKHKDELNKIYNDFATNFNSFHFLARKDARQKLNEFLVIADHNNQQCESDVGIKNAELQNRYLLNQKAYAKFDEVYATIHSQCSSSEGNEISPLYGQIETMITSIQDPEPDIETIKSNLMGQTIPGWKFDYMSEFKDAKILETNRSQDHLEYRCQFHLEGYTNQNLHECEVMLKYSDGSEGWLLEKFDMIYITYVNKAKVNDWQRVQPLTNCVFTIIDNGQKFWITEGQYGTRYKGGPDGDSYSLTSDEVFIMSREDHDVDLVFKYSPKN